MHKITAHTDIQVVVSNVSFSGDCMSLVFSDARSVTVPVIAFSRLLAATPNACEQWRLIGRSLGVHWEEIDEDLSVENIFLAYSLTRTEEYAHGSPAPTRV